jgi:hypothetical protein
VFPNPSVGKITIQSTNKLLQTLALYTIDGQQVFFESNIQSSSKCLDKLLLEKGVYFLIIDQTSTMKIVID